MDVSLYHWIIFNVSILILLGLDLWHFYLKPHSISIKEAVYTSAGWILIAFFFNIWIYMYYGSEPALQFLASYLLEKSLSVDNLFVFLMIFAHFKVPDNSKHIVLFYGILGAIVMRALLIWGGIELISNFHWVIQVFGVFLIIVGLKLLFAKEKEIEFEKNFLYRLVTRWVKVSPNYKEQNFFYKENSQWVATPLFLVLILIESIDLLFALDSVPAVLGITTDPFIVYTSNIFAILGLRSLFFVLEGLAKLFYLLHYAVALILVLIGTKMVLSYFFHVPVIITLTTIVSIITLALIGSYLFPLKENLDTKK